MKQFFVSGCLALALLNLSAFKAADPNEINQKLLQAFSAAYPQAAKIAWTENKEGYTVNFLDGSVRSVIDYDRQGQLIGSVRYFTDPTLLPQRLRWDFQRRFPGKTLYGITERSSGDETVWFLKLQDARQWITVEAGGEGGMRIVERFDKQS